jgi:hypothetical protein
LLLLLSILSIIIGYYLLLSISPDAPFDKTIATVKAATLLILLGGITIIIYLFRRNR